MRSLLRRQRRHALVSLAVFCALIAAPTFASEIVKCVAKDGSPLYQNFPCNIDSLGSLPSNSPVAKKSPGASGVKVDTTTRSTPANELRIGMSADEVRALLGEPEEMVEDEPRSGRISTWRYADGRFVQFDHKHRVLSVQR